MRAITLFLGWVALAGLPGCFDSSSDDEGGGSGSDGTTGSSDGTSGGTNTTTASTTNSTSDGTTTTTTGDPTTDSNSSGGTTDTTTTDGTGGSTTDSTTGGTGGADCPAATHTCVDGAPADWEGPVAINEVDVGNPLPACPSDFPTEGPIARGSFDPGNAQCDCQCGDPQGVQCGNVTVRHNSGGCMNFNPPTTELSPGECKSISLTSAWFSAGTATMAGGSCTSTDNHTLPTPAFGTQAVLCGGATEEDGCGADQVCVPQPAAPFDAELCIYRPGDHECPAGTDFSKKVLRYDDFTDTRSCTACGCDSPQGTCDGSVAFINSQGLNCMGLFQGSTNLGTCAGQQINNVDRLQYTSVVNAECSPTGGELQGDVQLTGAITLCCQP